MVAPASANEQSDLASLKASKAEVVCLNVASGKFFYRYRPDHCNYYDGGAPGPKIIGSADFPTRQVRWTHWGHATALGRGQYHVSGRWLPVRLKLRRPRVVCGQRVFTKIQLNLKTCGGRWTGWAEPTVVESCARNL